MDRKTRGNVGVLRTAHAYQLLGYNVLFPMGDLQKYDLVIEKRGTFNRVQVKTVSEKDGLIYADARVIGHNRKQINIYRPNKEDFDIIAIVEMKTQNVYAVPFTGEKHQFSLRIRDARNNQQKNIFPAKKYLLSTKEMVK